MTNDNDLIRRGDAMKACHAVADEAKSYGIPQMTLGAHTCRDAIRALPAAAPVVTVKPLVWVALSENFMAEDHIFGAIAITDQPEKYDAERSARILAALTIHPADPLSDPRVVALVEALKDVSQSLAWQCFGECRGYSEGLLSPRDALDNSSAAIRAIGGEA